MIIKLKNKNIALLLCLILLCITSCLNITSDIKNWIEIENIEDINGKYHFLSDDGVKIYLPDTFKKYTSSEYLKLLDSLATKKSYAFESRAVETLRDLDGNFYIYFDEAFGITYTINTLPYFPFSKRDASQLLGIIRMNNEKITKKEDIKFTKITAKYTGNKKQQIFRSIYKVDYPDTDLSLFSTAYIISSNGKTVMIKLSSIYDINFDPFIQKMIL
ncbi:hypothetical protein [Seonamhaeicola sp.]|uniref:hypothetical protein n=1 Tax=Seonamhaeicola sp. TaxID=1912245 RepID=UPI002603F3D8|nr:hypothetical protein [Seonamhaeicola sp.]